MTDTKDLQQRLREELPRALSGVALAPKGLLEEAAEAIQTLTAERDNLRTEIEQLRRDHDSQGGMLELTRARRDELEAENDALMADAERYRWLRNRVFKDGGDLGIQVAGAYDNFVGGSMADGFDAAIDAARTQSKTQEKP